jgi:hypothetical protein
MTSRCTAAGPCDFHRDRAADPGTAPDTAAKCPYYCDAGKCSRKAVVESRGGRSYCSKHAPGPGRPVSTGSAATPKVFFRLSAAERTRGEAVASTRGQSIGEMARRAFLDEIGVSR